jgi:hypothetical protein
MMEFCFAPDTAVQLEDGSYKTMESLEVGDRLAPLPSDSVVPVVTSLFRFDGTKTPMVRIGDVVVSASHFVEHDGQMVEATEHPHAIPLPSLPVLCCLNVTGHRFLVGRRRLLAADYDEDDSEAVVQATQAVAAAALNGADAEDTSRTVKTVPDYSLGLSNDAEVRMKDGTWKRIGDVRLGDVTKHAGTVKGLVKEACESVVETPCGPFAAAQLVWSVGKRQWRRAADVWPPTKGTHILSHLITERCGALELRGDVFVRDYREVALPEMEEAYAAKVRASVEERQRHRSV